MRWRRPLAALAAAALGVGLATAATPDAHAAVTGTFCAEEGKELDYAPVAEVEGLAAGTPVTGKSVTTGTTPDGFTGSYVGYIANALGKGKDLLLFRLKSDVIDGTESTGGLKGAGIWAGMSGSPVYDSQNRLIGAVAYSLTAENLPIAGVTPAEYMKTIGTTAVSASATLRVTSSNLRMSTAGVKAAGTTLVGRTLAPVKAVKVAGDFGTRENAFINATLARTPRTARSASFLRARDFMPAAAQSSSVTDDLVAGGNIAVLMADGDLVSGGVGTVTAICGTSVWAFGHPMDYVGKTSLLMANASVAMIVPDGAGLAGSYKQVSSFGDPVGMITEDRRVGVKGTERALTAADTFGVTVDVRNASAPGTTLATYHTDVASPDAAPSLVAALVGRAAYQQLDEWFSGTGQVDWTISFKREDGTEGSVSNSQVISDTYWFPEMSGDAPAEDVNAIVVNEFEDVAITNVAVTLTLKSEDALSYKASGVQVLSTTGTWGSLSGAKLKPGGSYSVRPQYVLKKNGKSGGTVTGDPIPFTLKTTAKTSGSFKIAAANTPDTLCEIDSNGDIVCTDWESVSSEDWTSFDDVLAALDAEQPYSTMLGALKYKLKKGSTSAAFTWAGPGVVTGSAKASFSIKP